MAQPISVIAIFDIGKTNKKLLLFNEQYQIVWEKSARFAETVDEDGFPCESIDRIVSSISESLHEVLQLKAYQVKAVNFSTYGASLVFLNRNGKVLTPLYNYLKPYPDSLVDLFQELHGDVKQISLETASPWLGSLNSGLQLFRLKYEQEKRFEEVRFVMHLPQFVSYCLTNVPCTDITSIGCHTLLWDFAQQTYHRWVQNEGLTAKLVPILPANKPLLVDYKRHPLQVGIGLHDSSAALIPYLVAFNEPFILISTGTWSISLNPFSTKPLSADELLNDCLTYLSFQHKPVKASRYAIGFIHDESVRAIADHFSLETNQIRTFGFNQSLIKEMWDDACAYPNCREARAMFNVHELNTYDSAEQAYHCLLFDLLVKQVKSTSWVLEERAVKRIFVDGGFSKNQVFMSLMAMFFPHWEIYAASMAQATALGAALVIHDAWNAESLPTDLISLRRFVAY
jgi:sugar (pentulose or hexulose) kinase